MPAPETSVVVERNLLIPLPDGAHLAADLYRPSGEGPWPAIVDIETLLRQRHPDLAFDDWHSRRGRTHERTRLHQAKCHCAAQ